MSDGTAAPVEGAKKRSHEKAIEQVFQTAEQAAAAVPAGAKRLHVWAMKCPKGEAFVVAPSEAAAFVVFARLALTVTATSTKKAKKEKAPNVKKRLADVIAQGENATTPEAKALVEQMKSIQAELAAARERRAAKKADASGAPAVPPGVPS